jgi:hypothetical protein
MRDRQLFKHHPWREMGKLKDWKVIWTDELPEGTWGLTVFEHRIVYMASGRTEAQRRCTIEHERRHILRGPAPIGHELREELVVDRLAARALLPSIRRIGHALAFHRADIESVADELWVDEDLLHKRLSALNRRERAWLDEQLSTILI